MNCGLGFLLLSFFCSTDKTIVNRKEIRSIMARAGENLIIMTGGLRAADDHTLDVISKISGTKTQ